MGSAIEGFRAPLKVAMGRRFAPEWEQGRRRER